MQSTRILLTGGPDLYFTGLYTQLQQMEGIEVTPADHESADPVQLIPQLQPHLVLVNIPASCSKALQLTHALHRQFPYLNLVAFSLFEDREGLAAAHQAGARGFLHKNCTPAELQEAVWKVRQGEGYYSRSCLRHLSALMDSGIISSANPARKPVLFSAQEQTIIRLICEEYGNKQIAGQLRLSENMIERYRSKIREKMGVKSVSGMVLYALRHGLYGQTG
jgi:DNA-binding NarL/FixJ family response regulator